MRMKIENTKAGQKVLAQGQKGTVMFTCFDAYTGKLPKIRVMLDSMIHREKCGFNGENFNPDEVSLLTT